MPGRRARADPPAAPERRLLGRVRLAGLAAALLTAGALAIGGNARIEGIVFDAYQRHRPRDLSGMRVQVVQIDPESMRLIGAWPWSRDDMARLTTRIGQAGAIAIGFDAIFPEADRQTPALFVRRYPELDDAARAAVLRLPSLDAAFADALGRYPTVLARAGVIEGSIDFGEPIYRDPAQLPVEAMFAAPLPDGVKRWPQAISSIPAIEETAAGHGLINGDPDPDGIVRRVPAAGSIGGVPTPGFAMELARLALGAESLRPLTAHGALAGIGIAGRTVPTDPDGRFRLHFGAMPAASVTSAADLFRRGFDLRRLAGKVVVLSVTGLGSSDVVATPIDAQAYGVDVQAQAVDAILRGGWLDRPRWAPWAELAAAFGLAGIAILSFPRLRGGWTIAVPLALAALTVAAGMLAFARAGLLLDPLRPLLIGGAAGLAVLVALFAESGFAQRRLRAALIGERVSAARTAGELAAAQDIQRGMLPARADLASLDARLDLDAILEPARSVGGDFYDAFRLPDGRIAFLVGDVTGKGVPAALFMALSKALARTMLIRGGDDLAVAVQALGTELAQGNAEAMFVTMLIGIVDPATGRVALLNAGHEDPLIVHADGSIAPLAMDGGPPLCAVDDFPYPVEPLTLGPGEGLIVVTDGVTEAQDGAGAMFDRAALLDALAPLDAGWRAGDATGALFRAVRTFEAGEEPSDDLTVLALRRTG